MPQLTSAAVLQLVLLLSALPAQYLISRWSGSTSAQRFHATSRLLRIWKEWRASFLNIATVWTDWANQQITKVKSFIGLEQEEEENMSLAIENMMQDNEMGYFGASKEVRDRPMFVFLRVGDVVIERNHNRLGVIVSWDPEPRAPAEWLKKMYSNFEGYQAQHTPHYKVLFSGPTSSSVFVGYLPQTQLQRITGVRPDIPMLENYFTHFDGERFVMQPWLREIFPEDEEEHEDF
ncbi:si:dkey-261l7.2 [Cheilinus undulatus]|uniref:si:dkey-261l7.2 n=1 Tax=Cheilinus undulatus TaxID=241271 RepID=UPI001BD58A3F|nr:si:dkey-261l7.2 [Cheilinus undulatus]